MHDTNPAVVNVQRKMALSHLEKVRSDIRDEIKKRIGQRDKYSNQLTLGLGAIFSWALSNSERRLCLLAAPLVSIYFTVLILYSYRVHGVLAKYLREEIEPAIAKAAGTHLQAEWETWYSTHEIPGIRRSFFIYALWAVTLLTLGYLLFADSSNSQVMAGICFCNGVILVAGFVFLLADILITVQFWGSDH
jgi:hypothetical protein